MSCAHVGDVCEELGHKNLVTWPPKVHPSLTHEFWVNADVNDALEALYKFAPRDFPLEMNGCAYGLCYAPFLAAHMYLGCSFEQLQEVLEPNCGKFITIPGLNKCGKSLRRSSSCDRQPVFWIFDGQEMTRASKAQNPNPHRNLINLT